jgi:hypothetical protein
MPVPPNTGLRHCRPTSAWSLLAASICHAHEDWMAWASAWSVFLLGVRRCACLTDPHLTTPGGRLQTCCWCIQADLAEMAGDGRLRAWARLPWQQGSRGAAPPAQELSLHRVSQWFTHAMSSFRIPGCSRQSLFLDTGPQLIIDRPLVSDRCQEMAKHLIAFHLVHKAPLLVHRRSLTPSLALPIRSVAEL